MGGVQYFAIGRPRSSRPITPERVRIATVSPEHDEVTFSIHNDDLLNIEKPRRAFYVGEADAAIAPSLRDVPPHQL